MLCMTGKLSSPSDDERNHEEMTTDVASGGEDRELRTHLCLWTPAEVGKKKKNLGSPSLLVFWAWSPQENLDRNIEEQGQKYNVFHLLVELYVIICFDAPIESDGKDFVF